MFQITKPGFYRQRNGGKAEVFAERDGRWYGITAGGHAEWWGTNGFQRAAAGEFSGDIVSVWTDEPKPAPFRISDNGCGIYERRDGKNESIVGKSLTGCETHPWRSEECHEGHRLYRDDGKRSGVESPGDLVRYIGPLPKPAETWTPTGRERDRVLNRDNGGPIPDGAFWSYRGGESKLVVREQCWVCGDREEWRVPEVCVSGDTEVSRG